MKTSLPRRALLVLLATSAFDAVAEDKTLLKSVQPRGAFIAISVGNAATAAQWYVDKLGFRIAKQIGPPVLPGHMVLLESEGAILELLEHPDAKPLREYRPDAAGEYLMHGVCKAGLLVKDIDAVLKQARERQIEIKHGMMDVPELKMRSFIIADIEGNLIQFYGK